MFNTCFRINKVLAVLAVLSLASICHAHDSSEHTHQETNTKLLSPNVKGNTTHYFGRINLLHYLPPVAAGAPLNDIEKIKASIPANLAPLLSHTFTLTNTSAQALSIGAIEPDCDCIEAHVKFLGQEKVPYIMPYNASFEVEVAINPYKVHSGGFNHQIRVWDQDKKQVSFTLNAQAFFENGISFGSSKDSIEDEMKLSGVLEGQERETLLYVTLDSRLPQYLQAGTKLRLVTTQPAIQLKLISSPYLKKLPEVKAIAVNIEDDIISFPHNQEKLSQDCVLIYRVKVSKETPPGPVNAFFVLATSKTPLYGFLHRIVVPVKGLVKPNKTSRVTPAKIKR